MAELRIDAPFRRVPAGNLVTISLAPRKEKRLVVKHRDLRPNTWRALEHERN